MCKRKDLGNLPTLPTINKNLIKQTDLGSVIEKTVDPKYRLKQKMIDTEKVWDSFLKLLKKNKIEVPRYPIWTDWWDSDGIGTSIMKTDPKKTTEENNTVVEKKQKDFYIKYKNWIDKNRAFYHKNKRILTPWLTESRAVELWKGAVRKMEWQAGDESLTMKKVLWSARGSGIRIKKCNYAPTLVAMASMIPVYGPKSRELTPRECARLQSFPDNFIINSKDKIAYKQFGNAVNVQMIERSARFLIKGEPLFI